MSNQDLNGILSTITAMIFSGNFSFEKIVGTFICFFITQNITTIVDYIKSKFNVVQEPANEKDPRFVSGIEIIDTNSKGFYSSNSYRQVVDIDNRIMDFIYINYFINNATQISGKVFSYQRTTGDIINIIEILDYVNIFENVDIKQKILKSTEQKEQTEKSPEPSSIRTIVTYNLTLRYTSIQDYNKFLKHCQDYNELLIKKQQAANYESRKLYSREYYVSQGKMNIKVNIFDSSKSMSNLFFNQKEIVTTALYNFKNKKEDYLRLGIPHTLSIMLYGKPGTGKTSLIKAIANYLRRDIAIIDTSIIKKEDFDSLFEKVKDNVYVIEEIDCGHWGEIIGPRTGKPKKKVVTYNFDLYPGSESESSSESESDSESNSDSDSEKKSKKTKNTTKNKSKKKSKKKKKPTTAHYESNYHGDLTLSDLLTFVDGIVEYPGRVMIYTTNHIEKIDPAFIRPGRMDLVLELGNLSNENVNSYYKSWFGEDIPEQVYSKMVANTFSQAQIGELFSTRNTEYILEKLAPTEPAR